MSSSNQEINIQASKEELNGSYSNALKVTHSQNEFVLDFFNLIGGQGTLSSRVIVSPSHLKRIIQTLQDNLKKYEDKFGNIEKADTSQGEKQIGF